MLRSAKVTDAPLIADIYNYYVDNTCITFALEHSTPQIYANMIAVGKYPFLVAETDDGQLSGFIFAHELRSRGAFRWDVELTVYLRPGFEGHGIGKALMTECIQLLTRQGYMTPTPALRCQTTAASGCIIRWASATSASGKRLATSTMRGTM